MERVGARQDDGVVVEARLHTTVVAVAELVETNRTLGVEIGRGYVARERSDSRRCCCNVAVPDGPLLYRHSDRLESHGPFMSQPAGRKSTHRQYDHDNEATAQAAAAALAPAVLGGVRVVVPGPGRVQAVERAAVHALTRRRAAVAAVVGAGGIVEGNVTGPVAGRRALVDVEERVVA